MDADSLDLRSLVDGLSEKRPAELRDAVATQLCREKYGADTLPGLRQRNRLARRGLGCEAKPLQVPGLRFGALSRTIFANAKLPLHKITRIVEAMCHNASLKLINEALERRIEPGSTIVHDCEKAHNALVKRIGLVDERHKANVTDPVFLEQMELVNHLCAWIRRYVERFACMKSENLQAYLDWFIYLHRVRRDEEKWPVEEKVVRHLALSSGVYLHGKWRQIITQLVDPCRV